MKAIGKGIGIVFNRLKGLVPFFKNLGRLLFNKSAGYLNNLFYDKTGSYNAEVVGMPCGAYVAANSSKIVTPVDLSGKQKFTFGGYFKRTDTSHYVSISQVQNSSLRVLLSWRGLLSAEVIFIITDGVSVHYGTCDLAGIGQYYIEGIFDGTQIGNANRMKVRIDGVEQTLSFTGTIPSIVPAITNKFTIGAVNTLSVYDSDGIIHSVGIWDDVKSYAETIARDETNILAYFPDALTGFDVSGNNNHGTPTDIIAGTADNQLYHFENGYQRFRHDTDAITNADILVPYKLDGTPINPTIADYSLLSNHPYIEAGNNLVGSIDFDPDSADPGFKVMQIFKKSNATYLVAEILDKPDYTSDYVWNAYDFIWDLLAYGTEATRTSLYFYLSTGNIDGLLTYFKDLGVYLTEKATNQLTQVSTKGNWADLLEVLNALHFNSQTELAIDLELGQGNTAFLDLSNNITKVLDWSYNRNHPVQGTSADRPALVKTASGIYMQGDAISESLLITNPGIITNLDFRIIFKRINDSNGYILASSSSHRVYVDATELSLRVNANFTNFTDIGRNVTGDGLTLYAIQRKNNVITALCVKSDKTLINSAITSNDNDNFDITYILSSALSTFSEGKVSKIFIQVAAQNTLQEITNEQLKLLI